MISVSSDQAWRMLRADAYSSVVRILDSARRLLGEASAVTLNRIASDAGVGIATLYRHFPNREALAGAVLERVFDEEVEPLLAEFTSGEASRSDLLAVAERISELLWRERGVLESIGNPVEFTAQFLARDGRLADTVARAKVAGNLRPDLREDDLPVLLAMLITWPGLLDAAPDARRRYLSLLLDGLNPAAAVPLPEVSVVVEGVR